MTRGLGVSLLRIVSLGLLVNFVCQAQGVPLMTRHVRAAVRTGQARPDLVVVE
jgi:hypothetical protein